MNKYIQLSLVIAFALFCGLGAASLHTSPGQAAPAPGTLKSGFLQLHLTRCAYNLTPECEQDFLAFPEAAKEILQDYPAAVAEITSRQIYRKAQVEGEFLGE